MDKINIKTLKIQLEEIFPNADKIGININNNIVKINLEYVLNNSKKKGSVGFDEN